MVRKVEPILKLCFSNQNKNKENNHKKQNQHSESKKNKSANVGVFEIYERMKSSGNNIRNKINLLYKEKK